MFRRRTRSGAAGKTSTRCWETCSTTRASGRVPESPFRQPPTTPSSRSRWMTMGQASIHPCALRCCSEGCGPTSRSGDQGSASRSSAISPSSTVALSRWRPRRSAGRAPDSSFHGSDERDAWYHPKTLAPSRHGPVRCRPRRATLSVTEGSMAGMRSFSAWNKVLRAAADLPAADRSPPASDVNPQPLSANADGGERAETALFAVSVRSTARVGRPPTRCDICMQLLLLPDRSNSTPSATLLTSCRDGQRPSSPDASGGSSRGRNIGWDRSLCGALYIVQPE
jgi:hypothetical protein